MGNRGGAKSRTEGTAPNLSLRFALLFPNSQCTQCQLDKIQPQKPHKTRKAKQSKTSKSLTPGYFAVTASFQKRARPIRANPSILTSQARLQAGGTHNQVVNIQPCENPRFAPFHNALKTNFILFAVPSPNSRKLYVQ